MSSDVCEALNLLHCRTCPFPLGMQPWLLWGRSATSSAVLIFNFAALHGVLPAPLWAVFVCLGDCLGLWRSLLR